MALLQPNDAFLLRHSLHTSLLSSIISCMSAYYRCTLKTQEFRTKDFVVRSTHSIERVERQIFSGKLTAKQEFYQRNPVRQGFDKNLYPHTFCCHTLRVHDTVWRMGFTRALLSTPILQTIS